MSELDARRHLSEEEMAKIPYASVFTLVGHGGWPTILDGAAPLMADGLGLDLPDGRALVRCQITACGCGRVRIWASAEAAAAHHGSWIARPDSGAGFVRDRATYALGGADRTG